MNKDSKKLLIQIGLFVATCVTTTLAGAEWTTGKYIFWTEPSMGWADFVKGTQFSVPFLLILSFHEFGHFFVARFHKIRVTLPYYIPLWFGFLGTFSFGTMGAFIRIKDIIYSRKHYFDIGIAGPIAGFVVALFFIWYGFTYLPEPEYIFQIHPEYEEFGLEYADFVYSDGNTVSIQFGDNVIYWFFKKYVADPVRLPNPNEIIHYPLILAGYLALFFTALNLLPIGQLDGGHIIFGLLGSKNHQKVSVALFTAFLFYAGLGVISIETLADASIESTAIFLLILLAYLYFLVLCSQSFIKQRRNQWLYASLILTGQFILHYFFGFTGYNGWMLFAFLLGRVIGVKHPPVADERELSIGRKVLGWLSLLIFLLSFSPQPFIIEGI